MKILGKRLFDRDFREIFSSEFISITGGLIAGTILLSIVNKLELVPGLFILLPGFLELHGNIFGSLAARLGELLHTKNIKPRYLNNKLLVTNVLASILLLIVVSLFLGFVASLINFWIFGVKSFVLVFIAIFAAFIAMVFELPLTVITTFWLFKNGYDLDDIMGPYVTTVGDIVSVLSIFLVLLVVI